ncbi:FoF1-type ATP synthase, membrane subunit b or b' [Actinacidiphila alni]|uniref:FoF1-type ATP synthase, membrane subunit b or b n=1 Tax=Actinacidiphila alni TaxID=380248 RepID=A0A1I1YH94_9ACTN|nr:hypothetical protein [Actinacidiphila alni]SFE18974.1 FoF1-type ATP synthase, membrane subunit b or b' [Actinacidiphila alni]
MSVRHLDWSPLDLDSDPVHADLDVVSGAQTRYQHIADTIDDAITKLQRIVDTNSDSLAGQYVEGLKSEAGTVKDSLTKAAVRYHDVAEEIKKYQPDLEQGLTETAAARDDAEEARNDQTKAKAMPDPQKKDDGTVTPEEQQKGTDKTKATDAADGKLTAAKNRLNNALNALNVAGKRFGDAVNCKKYDDGLTDSWKDKLDAVMAKISQIFAIIGMILGVLAILIPGVNALIIAGVVAGAITLVANIVLYADGKGSVVDVILGAVGLGLAGLGAIASLAAKGLANAAKTLGNLAGRPRPVTTNPPQLHWGPGAPIELQPMGPAAGGVRTGPSVVSGVNTVPGDFVIPVNPATGWTNMSDWFNNPATNWLLGKFGAITPEIGFWESAGMQFKGAGAMWGKLFTDPLNFVKDWAGVIGGLSGFRDLSAIMAAVGGKISPLWYVWGGLNGAFGMGGLIYTGGRLMGWIPAVNPPGVTA